MESYKLQIEILKIKLLFFSALVGGSFGYFLKVNEYFIAVLLIVLMTIGTLGIIKSLYNLGEIHKKLKDEL
ncbi:hypothetical protein [Caminibacter sp.]